MKSGIILKIVDLCPQFISDVLESGDRIAYENRFPELFDHYYEFYGSREKPLALIPENVLNSNRRTAIEELHRLRNPFTSRGFDIDKMEFILFVGQGSTNGHALKLGSKFPIWLPVETYYTSLLAHVFIAHEIIHALHYERSPEFYFEKREDMYHTGRLLVTEGMATYLTKEILEIDEGTALWADHLPKEDQSVWLDLCDENQGKIREILRRNFHGGQEGAVLFQANNPNDILEYRAGYYIGLKIIEKIADEDKLSVEDMLNIPREKFLKLAFDNL